MRYALTAAMAKETDRVTIEEIGVPSVVLMERAAEAVALKTAEIAALFNRGVRVLAVCGCGNNGADAIPLHLFLCDFQISYSLSFLRF